MINDITIDDFKINDNKEKLKVFYEKKISVHILLTSREWFNGEVKEVSDSFIILIERKKGVVPLFFNEIWSIEPLEVKE
jgi:hypothetical protein